MKPQITFLLSLTLLLLLLTGFSLGGFVDDVRFKGTSIGVTKCVERNKQEGLPHQLIKRRCVDENQKKLENTIVTGSAGYKSIKIKHKVSGFRKGTKSKWDIESDLGSDEPVPYLSNSIIKHNTNWSTYRY